jgi:3-oxochol-4-en-24-oyl-CoA dehydrogenase
VELVLSGPPNQTGPRKPPKPAGPPEPPGQLGLSGLPGADDPRRVRVREWLAAHPHPTGRQLAEAGYVVPHWAPPFGLDADPLTQLAIDEELREAGVRRPVNPIGIGWAGPTLLYAGTPAQQERWLWPLLSGEEFWCQLFSEPEAGSDLAALTTRAERDGDHYVINGQKVWNSYAHIAKWGILLARTEPGATKHRGISYFVCPMQAPGIEIRPLIDMTGEHAFNEVFFTDVRIPADHLVGAEHGGWELAKVTLGNERVSLSGEGALWGMGPTADDLVSLVRAAGGVAGVAGGGTASTATALRDRLVSVWMESQILRVLRLRSVSAVLAGKAPGAEASVRKAIADAHGQHVMNLARDLAGPFGLLSGTGPLGAGDGPGGGRGAGDSTWSRGFLYSPALTVGGGTAEVQRNIVAEKVLGLPRDP